MTANYTLVSGPATLTIIDYPTPQIAQAQESAIRAYLKAGSKAQPPWPKPLTDSDVASLEVRHSGPLVAVVSGDAVPEESHRLLESVHYEADLTAVPQPVESEVLKTSRLLLGIASLCIIGASAAIILGGFFGGGRALYRVATGKPASSVFDEEFIHLDLQGKMERNKRGNPRAASERLMSRSACGKMDANPKKHGEITAKDGRFEANIWRTKRGPQPRASIVKLLKIICLFSQTFSLDTASPRSYYAARKF